MGLPTGIPLAFLPPAANGSGSAILISGAATAGIVIWALHFGQGPVFPANLSLTEKRALQPGQSTSIGIKGLAEVRHGQEWCEVISFA